MIRQIPKFTAIPTCRESELNFDPALQDAPILSGTSSGRIYS